MTALTWSLFSQKGVASDVTRTFAPLSAITLSMLSANWTISFSSSALLLMPLRWACVSVWLPISFPALASVAKPAAFFWSPFPMFVRKNVTCTSGNSSSMGVRFWTWFSSASSNVKLTAPTCPFQGTVSIGDCAVANPARPIAKLQAATAVFAEKNDFLFSIFNTLNNCLER